MGSNTTAVIVALPSLMDPIRLVGDEEKHATILFFGETSSLPENAKEVLQGTVEQVARMTVPFSESILQTERLGDDDPPALVSHLTGRKLASIRETLQVNPDVKGYMANASQFPTYKPHVTLAYPDIKGEAELRKLIMDTYRVRFDRIALWWNDERIEFDLRIGLENDMVAPVAESAGWSETVAQGAEATEDILSHFGVKGMKWGVRNNQPRGKIRRGLTKANVALNAGGKVIDEGEKKLIFLPQKNRNKAASATQSRVLGEAAAINRSKQFKGKDIKNNPALKKAYFDKVENAAKKVYAEELGIARTEAWGDFLGVDTSSARTQMRITAARDRIRHAEDDDREVLLELNFELDALGHIVKVNVPDKFLTHDESDEDDVIVHYGVKGMKWGVRSKDTTPTSATVSQPKPGGKLQTSGGKNQPASEDARRAAAARQTAKASTVNALSNKELQELVTRLNLEQNYSRLTATQKSKGRKFAEAILGDIAKAETASRVSELAKDDDRLKPLSDALNKSMGIKQKKGDN